MGFYISPPPGKDWYEKHHQDSLYYFKNSKAANYALTTQATELFFTDNDDITGEILQYLTQDRLRHLDKGLLKNANFDYSVEELESSLCVRYQHSYDDYGNKKKGSFPYVKIFNKGIVCRHPNSPRVGIDINYMEKSLPETERVWSWRHEGELFLSSLNFYRPSSL